MLQLLSFAYPKLPLIIFRLHRYVRFVPKSKVVITR